MTILNEKIRYQLLRQLEQNPNLTQRELAAVLGVSLGKTNYCLNAVIEKGWVKVRNFRKSKQKLGYAYFLTPKGIEEKGQVTLRFLKRKQKEHEDLVLELQELREEVALFKLKQDKR